MDNIALFPLLDLLQRIGWFFYAKKREADLPILPFPLKAGVGIEAVPTAVFQDKPGARTQYAAFEYLIG
jgi:hypothetical protein